MGDQINVSLYAPAWKPTDDSIVDTVFNEYDVPLEGVIQQHGMRYYFRCLVGAMRANQMWVYAPLFNEREYQELVRTSVDDLDRVAHELLISRDLRVSLSTEARDVVFVMDLTPEDVAAAGHEVADAVLGRLDEISRVTGEMRREAVTS